MDNAFIIPFRLFCPAGRHSRIYGPVKTLGADFGQGLNSISSLQRAKDFPRLVDFLLSDQTGSDQHGKNEGIFATWNARGLWFWSTGEGGVFFFLPMQSGQRFCTLLVGV
jgi:hypothetical protein